MVALTRVTQRMALLSGATVQKKEGDEKKRSKIFMSLWLQARRRSRAEFPYMFFFHVEIVALHFTYPYVQRI